MGKFARWHLVSEHCNILNPENSQESERMPTGLANLPMLTTRDRFSV